MKHISIYIISIMMLQSCNYFTIKSDFNAVSIGPAINLSVIRNGSILNIGTYNIIESTTNVTIQTSNVSFTLLEGDLLVWATRASGSNRVSYTSLTFEFTY